MADLTPDDLARLLVPLTALPGFDPVGLRLYGPNPDINGVDDSGICSAVDVRGPEQDGPCDHVGVTFDVGEATWVERATMAVSLSGASSRDRIVRWLAGRVGLELGPTAPGWFPGTDGEPWWILTWTTDGDSDRWFLSDLDPTDDRRLPDGSRYVDALALARVATHVGGAT